MSDPQPSCIPTASSGVSSRWLPSVWERNVTPLSRTFTFPARLKIWNPQLWVESRSVPTHEPMQSACGNERFHSRSQHEVVGIGQDDLRAGGANLLWEQGLDCGLGADRHECWGSYDSVGSGHPSASSAARKIDVQQLELEGARRPDGCPRMCRREGPRRGVDTKGMSMSAKFTDVIRARNGCPVPVSAGHRPKRRGGDIRGLSHPQRPPRFGSPQTHS